MSRTSRRRVRESGRGRARARLECERLEDRLAAGSILDLFGVPLLGPALSPLPDPGLTTAEVPRAIPPSSLRSQTSGGALAQEGAGVGPVVSFVGPTTPPVTADGPGGANPGRPAPDETAWWRNGFPGPELGDDLAHASQQAASLADQGAGAGSRLPAGETVAANSAVGGAAQIPSGGGAVAAPVAGDSSLGAGVGLPLPQRG